MKRLFHCLIRLKRLTEVVDQNISSGSELQKRILAIESLPVNDRRNVQTRRTLPTGPKDFKIRTLDRLDFFFWTVKYLESAANLKMQNEKDTFIFISNIENMESALPLNEKLKNCGLITHKL